MKVDVSMWYLMRLRWRRHGREVSPDQLQESIVKRFECKKMHSDGCGGTAGIAGMGLMCSAGCEWGAPRTRQIVLVDNLYERFGP
jgi:hypothetical protein